MNIGKITVIALLGFLGIRNTQAQSPLLTIDRTMGPARLGVTGEPGSEYWLEACSDNPGSTNWELMVSATPTNWPWTWLDSASETAPRRFYRLARLTTSGPSILASDFRLIDHLGRSRHLNYHLSDTNIPSVVLVFTRNGCVKIHDMVSVIKLLRDQFAPAGVLFWMIDSDPADNRSNIVAEAAAQGIDLPILHDAAQLVAGEYGVTATPEAIALRRDSDGQTFNWALAYRGAIDDRLGPSASDTTQYYLSNALAGIVASQPLVISRAKADGCDLSNASSTVVSYSTDIAPLLDAKCVRCHSSGNIAPWAMTNYGIVQAYGSSIKERVLTGEMPPWHADPYYGTFVNDYSLSPQEAKMLVRWINDGAPRGDGPDPLAVAPPPPTNYPYSWPASLGQPDLVLSVPSQSIPASGVVDYRYLNVNTTFPTDTWIRAAIVLPGNTKAVHHCLVFFGSDSIFKGLLGFFAGYVPGYDPVAFPDGTGKLLPKGTVLQFQMHYITSGQVETDQTQIGLYLSSSPPERELKSKSAANITFSIAPNSRETEASATFAFGKDSTLYEMAPHMHLRGSRFRYEAVYPDNTREVLLSVPNYEFHWQTLYRLAQPKFMPAGTQLICTGAWDNTAQNEQLRQQFDASGGDSRLSPNQTVTFGEQTFDEMFIGYLNFSEIQ